MDRERMEGYAGGILKGVQLLTSYMRERVEQELLVGVMQKDDRETCLHGLFLRAASAMMSLSTLDHPTDFQAIIG